MTPEALLDRIVAQMRAIGPRAGIAVAHIDSWADRSRGPLLGVVKAALDERAAKGLPPLKLGVEVPPDEWTASRRTAANLDAMRTLQQLVTSSKPASGPETRVLAGYSGWGGLSIEKAAPHFPSGIPVPDSAGLIHEYYTPSRVAEAVASVVLGRLDTLPAGSDGKVRALEPSAGIGRFLRYLQSDRLTWQAAELSPLSSLFLTYLYPEVPVHRGSFEGWAAKHASQEAGSIGLVVANPPYGARGAERVDDPDREYSGYRKSIYHYFMHRASDLVARGGLGVWLIPMGFMHARSGPTAELRQAILRRQHIAAAFRLPSTLFPGANIVTDLVLLRARGGQLPTPLKADAYIADGRYFEAHPKHVLGTIVGEAAEDDTGKVGRRFMRIEGEFTALPDFEERPLDDAETLETFTVGGKAHRRSRGGIVATADDADLSKLPDEIAHAVQLGNRVDRFLADVATGQTARARDAYPELHAALLAWKATYGSPWNYLALRKLADSRQPALKALTRFLSAYQLDGSLSESIARPRTEPKRWSGRPDDVVGQALHYWRDRRSFVIAAFGEVHRSLGGRTSDAAIVQALLGQGWCYPYPALDRLEPAEEYLYGNLWPRWDAAVAVAREAGPGAAQARSQADRLIELIQPVEFSDIAGVDPRLGWVPVSLLGPWLGSKNVEYEQTINLEIERKDGLLQIVGIPYSTMSVSDAATEHWRYNRAQSTPTDISELPRWVAEAVGWLNHDYGLWRPAVSRNSDEDINQKRQEWQADALMHFAAWASATDERRDLIALAYNRSLRGFRARSYPADPMPIARWHLGPRTTPHPWQLVGARRVVANRGGLVAFDVGVGKTLTGLLVLATARQEGWARRPVLLVPLSLVWKWAADVRNALPDYRVVVIGSTRYAGRGGVMRTRTDDVDVQAQKWTQFQAGLHDVAICSYQSFNRLQVQAGSLRRYAESTEAIKREVKLQQDRLQEKAKKGKVELTERERAVLRHGLEGWLAEKLEPPAGQPYVPGITWEDVGVDLLIVDEIQNFKNLYMPQPRGQAGVPKFMGSGGEGSDRAWGLDFRSALVRERTGGAGIVGLSATPAKNSPLEFYNVLQYIDHGAWNATGIKDPETFIDRFIRIEMQHVIEPNGQVSLKPAAVAFQNLDEIRAVLDRYADFQTAESVSAKYPDRALVLPEPVSTPVYVDMDERQADRYDTLRIEANEIRQRMRGGDAGAAAAGQLLGVMARMALCSLHASLADSGWKWGNASELPEALRGSAKFTAVAERIRAQLGCGHIVFCENVAAHWWLREILESRGVVPKGRIAVLNAEVVPQSGRRVEIAEEFNGSEFDEPKYDVIICNSVAYEGIDLQRRTCAIHHLDLPWEPASIQQRNGRGVRQGNTRDVIGINYYLAKGSFDAIRFQMIAKKRGWLTTLVESQDRVTNNPGAQSDLSGSEIAALLASDPTEARKLLDEAKASIAIERRKLARAAAEDALRSANARLRRAERTSTTPDDVRRLRVEADGYITRLQAVDAEAWPWARLAERVRQQVPFVSRAKVSWSPPPLFAGLRLAVRASSGPVYWEVGNVSSNGLNVSIRRAGSWTVANIDLDGREGQFPPPVQIVPEDLDPAGYPADDVERVTREWVTNPYRSPTDLSAWATGTADAAWQIIGPKYAASPVARLYSFDGVAKLPLIVDGRLSLVPAPELRGRVPLAPTETGWTAFLAASRPAIEQERLTWTDCNVVARGWWLRPFPRAQGASDER